METEKWQGYEHLWTTPTDEYLLVRFAAKGEERLIIYHVTPTTEGSLVIEDDDVYEAVKQKMLDEGIKVVDRNYVLALKHRRKYQKPTS